MAKRKNFNVTVIGAGAVGSAIAKQFQARGHTIVGVINRRLSSTRRSAAALKTKALPYHLKGIPPTTNLLIISTPDSAIPSLAALVATRSPLNFEKLTAFHTSGAVTSDSLMPLRLLGSTVFSLHPIQIFPRRASLTSRVMSLRKIFYGIEGDAPALRTAMMLVSELGGSYIVVPAERKALYHVACVFASNYLVVLMNLLLKASEGLGINRKEFYRVFEPLITTTLDHVRRASPREALTGPIERGDVPTIRIHVEHLESLNPSLLSMYSSLGSSAVRLAMKKKSLNEVTARELLKIFETALLKSGGKSRF